MNSWLKEAKLRAKEKIRREKSEKFEIGTLMQWIESNPRGRRGRTKKKDTTSVQLETDNKNSKNNSINSNLNQNSKLSYEMNSGQIDYQELINNQELVNPKYNSFENQFQNTNPSNELVYEMNSNEQTDLVNRNYYSNSLNDSNLIISSRTENESEHNFQSSIDLPNLEVFDTSTIINCAFDLVT